MKKAVIFDFDGTLADTLPVCFYAFQQVFRKFDSTELSSEEIKAMFGPSETGIIRNNLTHESKDEAIELYYDMYLKHHDELVKNDQDIDDLLTHLKEEGYQLGIVTGKARRSLDISLAALQMENFFDVIMTGDDVDNPKPHPEGIFMALHLLGIKNEEALFIGDSEADILAGLAAKVTTIGVHWLPEYQTEDFTVQPDRMFKSVKEFQEAFSRKWSITKSL
ncbi:HAD-IA family hydrolase [Fictibacillus nanhaiensis]|uniref:HAD family hydrolase n=1 Tax=Fictibacillus nanhaiensis TaxID=742169 RepID=UPI001C9418EB|nr:HAD-IA family hydrolase [Fictibacillus nanhaiensis]MBY6036609.1 HAD-IA family hydrolase [Fictibacillus nanhaiensis]